MIARGWTQTRADLSDLLESIAVSLAPDWWLVSWPRSHILTTKPQDVTGSMEGRVFGKGGEVWWRVDEDVALMRAVTENSSGLPEGDIPDLALGAGSAATWYLWGSWNPEKGAWIEPRFPNVLGYEVKGRHVGDRVRVGVENLIPENGGTALERFVDVQVVGGRVHG